MNLVAQLSLTISQTVPEYMLLLELKEKLLAMGLHHFKKQLEKFAGLSISTNKIYGDVIGAVLVFPEYSRHGNEYKFDDGINEISIKQLGGSVDIIQEIKLIAYKILGDGQYEEFKNQLEIKLLPGNIFNLVDSYDLIATRVNNIKLNESTRMQMEIGALTDCRSINHRIETILGTAIKIGSGNRSTTSVENAVTTIDNLVIGAAKKKRVLLREGAGRIGDITITNTAAEDIIGDSDITNTSAPSPYLQLLNSIGNKRVIYSPHQINLICRLVRANRDHYRIDTAVAIKNCIRDINTIPGYETLNYRRLDKWFTIYDSCIKRNKWIKERISVVNTEFEGIVWSKLIWTHVFQEVNKDGNLVPTKKLGGNICLSYEVIRTAAKDARIQYKTNDSRVVNLQFSNKWVRGFLLRQGFTKKKVNSRHKAAPPSDSVINEHMKIQRESMFCKPASNSILQFMGRNTWLKPEYSQILNYDETAWHLTIAVSYLYSPKGIGRTYAPQGGNDDRERMTAIPTIFADGTLGPLMMIITDSSSMARPDQSNMRVLDLCLEHLRNRDGTNNWVLEDYETLLERKVGTVENNVSDTPDTKVGSKRASSTPHEGI